MLPCPARHRTDRLALAHARFNDVTASFILATRVGHSYRKASQRVQATVGIVTGAVNEVVGNRREVRIYRGMTREHTRSSEISGGCNSAI